MKRFLLLFAFFIATTTQAQIISTIVGDGFAGFTGDGGTATAARLNTPYGICTDAAGNIYIPDAGNRRIRKISTAGVISTIAGTGILGYTGDGGPATAAQLNEPSCVFVDGSGNIFIADLFNNCVRKIDVSGTITTVAGTGTAGFSGDGGAATTARLNRPYSIAVDATGNLFIADRLNSRIRKVDASGMISTVAGTGTAGFSGDGGAATAAQLFQPVSLCISSSGDMFITDWGNYRVRKVNATGTISTIAGNGTLSYADGVPAISTGLIYPYGVSIDCGGNVYVGEANGYRVRRINTAGTIHTIAGNGTFGYSGDGGPATAAQLLLPMALSLDAAGDMLVSDQGNHCIRKITNPGIGPVITGPNNVCVGSSATLTAASGGGTWGTTTGNTSITSGGVYTGLTVGVDTITYTGCSSQSRYPVSVNTTPTVSAISGPANVCAGATITLTNATGGGVWSSGSTSVATITSGGTVSGISAGTTTITYSITTSCGTAATYHTVTVDPLPTVAPITGPTLICDDLGIDLADVTPGGTWTSTNTSIAIVSTTGHVTGLLHGVDTIIYTVTNPCGSTSAQHIVTVMSVPAVTSIFGPSVLCADSTITLYDTTVGGTWSHSFSSITTLGSTGIVTGLVPGFDSIKYSATNACGTTTVYHIVQVINCDTILGVHSLSPQSISIAPNPAEESFTISGNINTTISDNVLLEMRDVTGRIVYTNSIKAENGVIAEKVNIGSALNNGIYTLTLISATDNKVLRFVIQH
ncbi:MAG: Leucinerich repeat protein-like protein [Flavipsychrobacter sp.]|jgi:sugar lactone lactonase YvrE|nr:Leucinerich repeat protein-like protein [Flavipsychrobacter sp.]